MLQLSLPSLQPQLLHPQARLQWKKFADVPVDMHSAQAVVMGEMVYVGGGDISMTDTVSSSTTHPGMSGAISLPIPAN